MKQYLSRLFGIQSQLIKSQNKCGHIDEAAACCSLRSGIADVSPYYGQFLIIACNNHIGLCCSRQTDDRIIRFPAQVVWRDFVHDGNLRASPEGSQRASSVIKGSKLVCCREAKRISERWLTNSSGDRKYMTHHWGICICGAAASVSLTFSLFYLLGRSFRCPYNVNWPIMAAIIVNGFPSTNLDVKKLPCCLQQSAKLLLTTWTNAVFMCVLQVEVNKCVWLGG